MAMKWDPEKRMFRMKVPPRPKLDEVKPYNDLAHLKPEHRRVIEASRRRFLRERGLLD
jgi:hypothetical protein